MELLFTPTETLHFSHRLSLQPTSALAPPPLKSRTRRALLKPRRRTKRRSPPPPGGDELPFFLSGDGDDGGGFSSGGGGGSGRGWNFDGWFHDWDGDDHSSSSGPDDPAFDFVYEVVCWIVFSNCLHFAFKRVLSMMVSGEREKVVSIC